MLLVDNEVCVRDFVVEDIPSKIIWINDPDNHRYLHYQLPLEYDKTLRWFQTRNLAMRCDCTIEYEGRPVGLIGLLNFDDFSKKAELYITLGDTQFKRKGIGYRALQLILDYGFNELDLNKIYLNVDAENVGACRLYEKAGFLCEGFFREDLMHQGKMIDRKRYAILRRERQ